MPRTYVDKSPSMPSPAGKLQAGHGEAATAEVRAAPRPRLDGLSGLRLLAIVHVILFHLGGASFEEAPMMIERFRRQANVVMPLFFVLSGFVLTYNYQAPITAGGLTGRAFLVSRLLRLWPIYLVALALRFAVDVYQHGGVPPAYVAGTIAQGLMLQGFTPSLVWFGNAPGWTVSVELFMYLLFPWLVVTLSKLTFRRALLIAGTLWFSGQLVSLAYALWLPDGWPLPGPPSEVFLDLLRFFPPFHLPSFVIGMLTAQRLMAVQSGARVGSGGPFTLAGFVVVLFVLAGGLQFLGRHGVSFIRWPFPFTHNGLLAPAWALVVYGIARGGAVARVLSARPLVRLGEASYALYILHYPLFDAVTAWGLPEWNKNTLFLVQLFAILLPLSLLSFEHFEQPLRRTLLARWGLPVGWRGAPRQDFAR